MTEEIKQNILQLEGVDFVHITENRSCVYDKKKGLPPLSFKLYVRGGKKKEIAEALWLYKPLGILSVGNTSVKVKDRYGYKWEVNFERIL